MDLETGLNPLTAVIANTKEDSDSGEEISVREALMKSLSCAASAHSRQVRVHSMSDRES